MKLTKYLCLFLSILLLAGCGKQPDPTAQTTAPTEQPTTTATEPTTFRDTLLNTEPYSEPQDPAERLAYRRDLVEAEMRRITSMYWTPAEDFSYIHDRKSNEKVVRKAGVIYQGIPYSHGGGSGFAFVSFATEQDDRGVYTLEGLDGSLMSGQIETARVGNDCADAVFWSWSRVATSITFTKTKEMTEASGNIIKVGDYKCDVPIYASHTKDVVAKNGADRMMACYAQMQKGDGMVRYTNSSMGHAVMVVDVHVVKNGDKIDRHKSYVTILEQNYYDTEYYDEHIGENVHRLCGVDVQWSFDYLLDIGYLPITCKELVDPAPMSAETMEDSIKKHSLDTILSGTLKSNYIFSSVTITIKDAEGKTVQECTGFPRQNDDRYAYKMSLFRIPAEQKLMYGSCDPEALAPGQYRCIVTAQVSTGRTFTVRDFNFTVS